MEGKDRKDRTTQTVQDQSKKRTRGMAKSKGKETGRTDSLRRRENGGGGRGMKDNNAGVSNSTVAR